MPRLFSTFTHYFTMSHGEGWDLNCIECAAMGKIIVAPEHTAYTDYLNEEIAYLIRNNKKIPAVHDVPSINMLCRGGLWFEPNEEETISLLRESVENFSRAQIKAKNCTKYILENFTWEKSIKPLSEFFKNL
jgi:hypothetical protein